MRTLILSVLCSILIACGGGMDTGGPKTQCNDGIDNDGDGLVDFPEDPGCVSLTDDTEDSLPSPQCSDGRDNDNDGKIDFPNDPGCFAPQQDSETDDCPNGPNCPQCSNGKDDDNNHLIDYPNDPGCASAADTDEFTDNPAACGSNLTVHLLPFDGHVAGMLPLGGASNLISPTCGGGGAEDVYELRINSPKVVIATTDRAGTTADTVLYIRTADCMNAATELSCNDDATMGSVMGASSLSQSISTPGVYYLVVDAHDSGAGGNYDLQVDFLAGEGELCDLPTSCGPGLVCRIPLGGTVKVCSKHVCSDGVDDDGDGKNDYPTDPGCSSPTDDDEVDTCVAGVNPVGNGCPECSDGRDNDNDTKTDYPNDTTCTSAADQSESCPSTDGVTLITTASVMGTTVGAHNDVVLSCGSSTATAPDLTYRLDVPALNSLTITTTASFDAVTGLFGSTCTGTVVGGATVGCQDFSAINEAGLAAGSYYVVIDGYSTGSGTFTLNIAGKIAANGRCDGTLATAGALVCDAGSSCVAGTCIPVACSNGADDDGVNGIDYPYDRGCSSPLDTTEGPNGAATACSAIFPANNTSGAVAAAVGCSSAADTNTVFCSTEHDPTAPITATTMTGTTMAKANDELPSCSSTSNAPDIVYSLFLPVPAANLTIDTVGSSFDTVLSFIDTHCTTTIKCDDDSGGSLKSKITLGNVAAGNYAVIVDGYSTNSGTVTLNTVATVSPGTTCSSPAFSGATAYMKCPAATTCSTNASCPTAAACCH